MSPLLRALPLFSAIYAVLYAIAMYFNIAMFVYYPQTGEWHWHEVPGPRVPAIFWYGWIANAAISAAIVAVLLAYVPVLQRRVAAIGAWSLPLAAILTVLFIIRGWFIR